MHSIVDRKLPGQGLEFGALGTFPDQVHRQRRKLGSDGGNGPQEQIMAFDWNQVANTQDSGRRGGFVAGRKQLGINAVVHDGSPATRASTFENLFANVFTDADHSPRRAVDALRDAPTPFACTSADLLARKSVKTMNRNDVRQTKFGGEKHGSMPAR